jgi:hypothetical protein
MRTLITRIRLAWRDAPYPVKAAIARFVRVVAASLATAVTAVNAAGLGPAAAGTLYLAAIVNGLVLGLDVGIRQVRAERAIRDFVFDIPGDDEIEVSGV